MFFVYFLKKDVFKGGKLHLINLVKIGGTVLGVFVISFAKFLGH